VFTLRPVLIIPPGHQKEVERRRRNRSKRDKIGMYVGAVAMVAVVALVLFSLTNHQRKSGHGCIDFNYITMIGGAEWYQCGADARFSCLQPSIKNDPDPGFHKDLIEACRKAGIETASS
jgi:hypothetical protein